MLLPNFRLLICNEVHCAAPRCLRWFAPQTPVCRGIDRSVLGDRKFTSSLVVEYIATVPSVYVALVPVVDYIAPAPSVYATPALVVMYIAPASSLYVSPSPIVEHTAPTQAMSYAEEFYESSSHVRRRLLATRSGEQCFLVSLFVDTFHSCYKVSITKLTHRQLLCSPRTVGNAPHQGACADLEMEKKKNITARLRPWDRAVDLGTSEPSSLTVS